MNKNEKRLQTLVDFFKYNGFTVTWCNSSSIRMDRQLKNKLEIVYIPLSPLCRVYNEIHYKLA